MLESFYEELSRNPGDWGVRSVMADWCEEHDRTLHAECLRWMVRHRKRPLHSLLGTFTWFNADTILGDLGDPESDVPGVIYRYLKGRVTVNHRVYETLREAEEDFLAAWALARQQGWKPDHESNSRDRSGPAAE
jgi:uncharacterized protein (TIGR02996 family)